MAETKLKIVEKLEEENRLLKVAVEKSAEELVEVKKYYAKWETKFGQVTTKRAKLEQFVEEYDKDMRKNLKGML